MLGSSILSQQERKNAVDGRAKELIVGPYAQPLQGSKE